MHISDIEIARAAEIRTAAEVASSAGISEEDIHPYGRYLCKIGPGAMEKARGNPQGRLILVTAVTPTPYGEGKTTTSIGLAQALALTGRKAAVAIREPSLGPCMGVKGGAAGGGYSQVLPMEEINLHMTGDIHAVSISHNLVSALIDNHIHHGGLPEINPRDIRWRRVIDMNDRTLRNIIVGLDGRGSNGVMREDGFDITASSELMAILCLCENLADFKEKTGEIIAGYSRLRKPVNLRELGINGAVAALMKQALMPNLAQTIEGAPAFIHGGPFANIAHGCNSVIATRMALAHCDYAVTEAGFGADLGAEKFFNIKCRKSGLSPSAAVIVLTLRSLKIHGMENLKKHCENISAFNVPFVVSLNRFAGDDEAELNSAVRACEKEGLRVFITDFRERGGGGGIELAGEVASLCSRECAFRYLYPLDLPLKEKFEIIAREIYGASGVEYSPAAERELGHIENIGYGGLPVCAAKTPFSLSDNPELKGRPRGFKISVTGARVSAGAGFVVMYAGPVMTMPGLPARPAALSIDIDRAGNISGLF